ncbi:hypothetical protein [Lactococcus termiticola]|uniref:Uncharacterized protein n=1 Tax=Lactococcus termiticola TaxID=2169526 RepID=A0A2R5HKY4_9LACT|nr:hypothetical protein [Lactococcus termiticola]GBG97371.1 hypothetical protein NtB2_01511 [Lactococcus termiticola]
MENRGYKIILAGLIFLGLSIIGIFTVVKAAEGYLQERAKIEATARSAEMLKFQDRVREHLLNGDYSVLEGSWESKEDASERYLIKADQFYYKDKSYHLADGGQEATGLLYINSLNRQKRSSAKLYFYPAGQIIPVYDIDGMTDWSGENDPTDRTKDRLLFAQSTLTPAELARRVCYYTGS